MGVITLLGIAFLAGVITATSPCVLPVLPMLLAGGASGKERRRPYVIVLGLVASFTAFTLGGAALLHALGLPADFLRDLAIAALLVLAASLVSSRIARALERPFLYLTRRRAAGDGALVLGVSLGLVFVPCAGPVLAAVTALSATGDVTFHIVLVTASYSVGTALPMLAIAVGGSRLSSGVRLLRTHSAAVRRGAGVLVGGAAIAIALGADQRFTTAIPGYTEALQARIEQSSAAVRELARLGGSGEANAATARATHEAPEFREIEDWLNTPAGRALTLAELRGRVVLVDFWTYSCINCLRTLPHLKAWDRAYRDAGLTIVGVHSPEFAFERDHGNVRSAVRRLGLRYPVALDNAFGTWKAYGNRYWPAKYLIDRSGRIRYHHFGEGEYRETERWIRRLVGEPTLEPEASASDGQPREPSTPESYLGYLRLDRFANGRVALDAAWDYRFPEGRLPPHHVAYDGTWTVERERIVAGSDARLHLRFQAREIFLVLGGTGTVTVAVDGRRTHSFLVDGRPDLRMIAHFPRSRHGLLELRLTPGLEAYAFTFG